MTYKLYLILFLAISLASCGGESSNRLNLEGRWLSSCQLRLVSEGELNFVEHSDEYVFTGDTFEYSLKEWPNSTCGEGDGEITKIWTGTYIVGKPIITSSGLEAVEIDIKYDDGFNWLQIIKLNGNNFYFGIMDGGDRPVELDFEVLFTKQ